MELREAMDTLIQMRDVLKDMKWHRRLNKKIAIVGDLSKIKSEVVKNPILARNPEDADELMESLQSLEAAVDDDKYIDARKSLETTIKSLARLVADAEIEAWRKGK